MRAWVDCADCGVRSGGIGRQHRRGRGQPHHRIVDARGQFGCDLYDFRRRRRALQHTLRSSGESACGTARRLRSWARHAFAAPRSALDTDVDRRVQLHRLRFLCPAGFRQLDLPQVPVPALIAGPGTTALRARPSRSPVQTERICRPRRLSVPACRAACPARLERSTHTWRDRTRAASPAQLASSATV